MLEKLKILWVDDDRLIRRIAPELLTQFDVECEIAGSAEAALEKLEKKKYNLLVTDINMPGMNGCELIDNVVNSLKLPITIAVTTGWNESEITEKLHYLKIDHVLTKPFKIEQIRSLIYGQVQKLETGAA